MAAARKAKKKTPSKASGRKPSVTPPKTSQKKKVTKSVAPKTKVVARKKSKAKTKRNSIDSILEKFEKQRTEQQFKLASVRKKIAQLEDKTKAQQAEIVSLKAAEASAETIIGTLDVDRDQAVQELLEKLGVKLVAPAKSANKKPRNSKPRSTKKKVGKPRSRKETSVSEIAPLTEESPAVIQATPLFDSVLGAPTSNGNPPSATILPSSSSSDELLEDGD